MNESSMKAWQSTSQVSGLSSAYLDDLYEQYLENPDSVDASWQKYFDSLQMTAAVDSEVLHSEVREHFIQLGRHPHFLSSSPAISDTGEHAALSHVMDLIYAYRYVGHKNANLDPLGLNEGRDLAPELSLEFHGLTDTQLSTTFNVGVFSDHVPLPLSVIVERLESTYCGSIGFEYMHMTNMAEKMWIRSHIESVHKPLQDERKVWLLQRLTAAEGLEKYLGMKYVGQKRFSLEGGESLIPVLNTLIDQAGESQVKEMVIGMAHRGRLNVLVNILGKSPEALFKEFEGSQDKAFLSGDVKYHMGFSSNHRTSSGNDVHLSLAFNPSHLETVDAIVEGSAKARQDRRLRNAGLSNHSANAKEAQVVFDEVLPILMHGDAAFCGQGIVMETLALSQTRHYSTGGTIHIISNNQVGFTTSRKVDARSSLYCTDIAKMIEAPVFHVNADDPEAVLRVTEMAMAYRMKFHKDVVIDLFCYRRHGHNEADEPSGTQPRMYSVIKKLPTTRALYADQLMSQTILRKQDVLDLQKAYRQALEDRMVVADLSTITASSDWSPYIDQVWDQTYVSGCSKQQMLALAKRLFEIPASFKLQPQVAKAYADRVKMMAGELPINWGCAEMMAYATLLEGNHSIRLAGEDSGRGTFSHRHAILHNYDPTSDVREYSPLQAIAQNSNATVEVIDSILSEYAVLGFEYGYSGSSPETLVIWEAQFGDFANTAQVVIDQFIASAEEKWGRLSGLVMLLPHGQEGMGAEHSSARLERYLQLCAHDNIQVCTPSTPAQIYHLLRRQVLRPYRKPLIVMSPKSLLRNQACVSTIDDLVNGQFCNVISETSLKVVSSKVTRVLLCGGKVYFELLAKRDEAALNHIAIVRIEQLYPFPVQEFKEVLKAYGHVEDIIWVQEEPENQGAWWMLHHELKKHVNVNQNIDVVARSVSSAPAVGYPSLFRAQQSDLIDRALKLKK